MYVRYSISTSARAHTHTLLYSVQRMATPRS